MDLRHIVAASSLAFAASASSAIDFEGATMTPVRVPAEASTGLEAIYVAPDTRGLTMVYTAKSPQSTVKWYRFSNLGGAYAEELTPTKSGTRVSIQAQPSDMGYIIEEGLDRTCYWLVNYSEHWLDMQSLDIAPEQDCDRAALTFTGSAAEIPYYTINGRRLVLSRELEIEYTTLAFNEDSYSYLPYPAEETIASVGHEIHVPAPLCDTSFKLSGDRFLRAWGQEQSIESPTFTSRSVIAETKATQTVRDVDNEQKDSSTDGLGGSAPCEISFEAAVSDAAIFTEWQISRNPDFGIPDNTFNELSFDYTFTTQGNTYVRFVANNAEGTCEFVGPTYQIFIGESKLEIPNAFSPEASPGVNDLWKVSYKSLVSYECHIFNRWGTELFSSTDPAEGWDGRHGGKFVPAGVYFYVIKARGADGIDYEKAGDINIIKYDGGNTTRPTE